MVIEYDEGYITPRNADYERDLARANAELKRLKESNAERQRKWRMKQKIKKQSDTKF